ncbi:MAG: Mo-dependent nitrogenase C-terminal domain-containing protein [Cyanobacteria bacterium J06614_10]
MSIFTLSPTSFSPFTPLKPLRQWLNNFEINSVRTAKWICQLIPNTCSTGYDFRLLGLLRWRLPSLCKLNPLADELVDLRFRAADFLYEHS